MRFFHYVDPGALVVLLVGSIIAILGFVIVKGTERQEALRRQANRRQSELRDAAYDTLGPAAAPDWLKGRIKWNGHWELPMDVADSGEEGLAAMLAALKSNKVR